MTLQGKYSKEETIRHGILKFLCYILSIRNGNKAEVEFNAGPGIGIFDCVDWTNGLVYEPIGSKSKKIRESKMRKYLKYAGIKDVIYINTKDYHYDEPVSVWIERLSKVII